MFDFNKQIKHENAEKYNYSIICDKKSKKSVY